MQLINPINTSTGIIIACFESSVTHAACAALLINNAKSIAIQQTIGACALDARDLRNGFSEEYGDYADEVLKNMIRHY